VRPDHGNPLLRRLFVFSWLNLLCRPCPVSVQNDGSGASRLLSESRNRLHPVELDYALLADSAQVSEGKTYILGGGVTILWRSEFPAPLGFSIVCQFTYERTEADTEHTIRFVIMDADGNKLIPDIEGSMRLGPPAPHIPSNVPLAIPLVVALPPAPVVQRPGAYQVQILLDSRHMATLPFSAAHPPQAPSPG
jgi:hypothetical protein